MANARIQSGVDVSDVKDSKNQKGAKPRTKSDKNINQEYGGNSGGSSYEETLGRKAMPNLQSLERNVLQNIVGQDEPVRQIITSIYKSIVFRSLKSNILIMGNSGTGKTETVKQILKRFQIPYTIEDATKYTQEGYYGSDVIEMFYNLLDSAHEDIERAQYGVIVVDEIDKKAGRFSDGERDVSGIEVLNSLLKLIEGSKIPINQYESMDTSNIIIIFLGAFSGLEKIRDERLRKNSVGFSISENSADTSDSRILKQDLVKYGFPEEFVGRIGTIVQMNKLKVEDLVSILRNSKLSIFRRYQKELRERGICLSYSGKLFESIARKSLSLDTGARELTNTVNYIFERIMYEILSEPNKYRRRKHVTNYHKCILYPGIVNDNTQYRII